MATKRERQRGALKRWIKRIEGLVRIQTIQGRIIHRDDERLWDKFSQEMVTKMNPEARNIYHQGRQGDRAMALMDWIVPKLEFARAQEALLRQQLGYQPEDVVR